MQTFLKRLEMPSVTNTNHFEAWTHRVNMVKTFLVILVTITLFGQIDGYPKRSESGFEQSAIANNPCSEGYSLSTNGDCAKPETIDTTQSNDYTDLFLNEETSTKPDPKPTKTSKSDVSKMGPLLGVYVYSTVILKILY